MRRDRFMLDTNAVLFYLRGSSRLPKEIDQKISYSYGDFFVSVLSIIEIVNKTQSGRVLLTKRLTVDKLVSELENQGIEVLPYVFTEDEYSKIYDLKNITELKSNHSVYINSNIQSYDDANFLDLIQNRLQEKESRYKVEYQFPIMISEDGNVRFLLPNTYRGVKYEWFSDTNGFLDFDKAYFETDLENFSKIILQ